MTANSLLIYATRGTYGRDDDAFGAMMAANAALAKGLDVTLLLVEDGVAMVKKGQSPAGIGMPNNLTELDDFRDLGGRIVAVKESLEERGISNDEIIDDVDILSFHELVSVIEGNSISLTL